MALRAFTALGFLAFFLRVSAGAQYGISPLGSVAGAMDTFPSLINNSQIIIGSVYSGDPRARSPYFLSVGTPVPLAPPPDGSVFSANAINASGTVAGFFTTDLSNPAGPSYAAALFQNGQYVPLQPPGHNTSNNFRAQAINNAGQVVGFVQLGDHLGRPVIWTNGQPDFVDPNPTESGGANAINDLGWIAGGIMSASARIAAPVLWRNGAMTTISLPASANGGTALMVNNAGQVLVSYFALFNNPGTDGPYGEERLLLWDNGAEAILPEFTGESWQETFPTAMNNSGDIVGWSGGRAVLWHAGQISDLNTLIPADSGWELIYANSLNDAGDIVGSGSFNGLAQPFLLTPIPEPATLLPVLAATAALLSKRRR